MSLGFAKTSRQGELRETKAMEKFAVVKEASGAILGCFDWSNDGSTDGSMIGFCEGVTEGTMDGLEVGVN